MPSIQLHNSLSKSLETLQKEAGETVKIYSCGPTVYDSAHLGHARSFLAWDLLVRSLRYLGFRVHWVRNITDVDDKIIARASGLGLSCEQLARQETYKFWRDMQALSVSWPEAEPRATEYMPQMVSFIEGLITKDLAYKLPSGDIYFRVKNLESYGQLKKLSPNEDNLARIEHECGKEAACDFVLWKAASADEYGFPTPLGYGRPGWHLECSTMVKALLGETIDIHTGGEDLLFPHHENEIAQSEGLHNKTFSHFWLHNGMIMIEGKKMSKSLGNFITVSEALERYSANALRFFAFSAHYRQPINYCPEALQGAETSIQKLVNLAQPIGNEQPAPVSAEHELSFRAALTADLNSSKALAVCFELAHQIKAGERSLVSTLRHFLLVLGFELTQTAPSQQASTGSEDQLLALLSQLRSQARQEKHFAYADRIRDGLLALGFQFRDNPDGTSSLESLSMI